MLTITVLIFFACFAIFVVQFRSRHKQRLKLQPLEIRTGGTHWKAMLDSTVDSVVICNQQGIVLSCSQATERMFGHACDELIGKNISLLMPPEVAVRHDDYMATYERTGKRKVIGIGRETVGLHQDGHLVDIDLAVTETFFGRKKYYIGIMRDITERRMLQRAKSQFVANVSHEVLALCYIIHTD